MGIQTLGDITGTTERFNYRQHLQSTTDITHTSASLLAATASTACLAARIAADITVLDSGKAVTALAFSTTGGCIAARVHTVDNALTLLTPACLELGKAQPYTVVHVDYHGCCCLLQRTLPMVSRSCCLDEPHLPEKRAASLVPLVLLVATVWR